MIITRPTAAAAKDIPLTAVITGRKREKIDSMDSLNSSSYPSVREDDARNFMLTESWAPSTGYHCVTRLFIICQSPGDKRPAANRLLGFTDDLIDLITCNYTRASTADFGDQEQLPQGTSDQRRLNMASRTRPLLSLRVVNGNVAPATNRRACCSKRSSKPSFPSMKRGLVGATMTGCDPDSIGVAIYTSRRVIRLVTL